MNLLEAALRRINIDLDTLGARWAIVGGLAVSARAEPRTTRDIDVVVAVASDQEAERVVHSLQSMGYRSHALVEHVAAQRLATARLSAPLDRVLVVDLLFASSGIEAEIVAAADLLEIIPGVIARVASIGHLLALKVLARDDRTRPQDWDDIRALLEEAAPDDLSVARAALALIQSRGYGRQRSLLAQFEEILSNQ